MTGERWRRIEAVFGDAVELPEAERAAFVTERCADDETLRDEILVLLDRDAAVTLDDVIGAAARDFVTAVASERTGQRFGAYRIVEPIGRGGMGVVYRAVRDDGEFHRTVAIKVLELGSGARALARLRDERQILATLDHPNIVRLLDGGTTDDGLPYLVLEHVDGVPITTFARDLSVAACIELVITLCGALAYAHERGVIHRDLKPSNVLVGERGPLLLDFGIAKLVAPSIEREAETRTGATLLTPEYASPEQARGEHVTPATDIYSLGVVLYELLAQHRPLELHGNMLEVLRVISEVEPPKPSAVAPAGRTIDRDLDRIVLGALRKRPTERYASATALAADLSAYLAGRRVSPPAPRRKRAHVLVTVACAVLVAAAAVGAVALRSRSWLPAGDHVLAVHVTGDALAPAVARMTVRAFRDRERRFVTVDDASAADVTAELVFRRDGDGVILGGELVARGRVPLHDVHATSAEAALATLVPAIGDAIGGGGAPRPPDAAERAAMTRIGATSFDEYREYTAIETEQLSTAMTESDEVIARFEALAARDPTWAHPWVWLALLSDDHYRIGEDVFATIAHARAQLGATSRDPAGRAALDALELLDRGDATAAANLLAPFATADPDDMLVALVLHDIYNVGHRADEHIAQLQLMHERRPDLQWGADLVGALRANGRTAEIVPLVRAWIAREPDSEQAMVSLIASELEMHATGNVPEQIHALQILREPKPHRLVVLSDLLIAADRTHEAAAVAEKLLHGSVTFRAQGLQRLATVEILEGRFAPALETLLPVGHDADALGRVVPLLEIGHDLALALHRDDMVERFDAALVARHSDNDAAIGDRERRFERELSAGRCPNITAVLDDVHWPTLGTTRDEAHRWLLRAAAAYGCAPCKDVVSAGVVPQEWDLRSEFRFASCVEAEGDLPHAADLFAKLREPRLITIEQSDGLPFVWVMARFRHARVLERLGRTDDARREYEDFLAHWGHADHSLPELAEARAALARLAK